MVGARRHQRSANPSSAEAKGTCTNVHMQMHKQMLHVAHAQGHKPMGATDGSRNKCWQVDGL